MSPSRIAACLSLLAVPLAACSGGPSNNSQESAGGMSMTAAAPHSCVFQTRLVTHCNGETDGLWVSRCDDGPCPATLPDDASEFPNIEGGWLCVSLYENRNVVDIAGTCAEWTSAGFPDTPPDHIYCWRLAPIQSVRRGHGRLWRMHRLRTGILRSGAERL